MARLSDDQRKAIADDLRATHGTPDGAYRRVAQRNNVSFSTVRNVARSCGIEIGDDARACTRNATAAKIEDNAARRAMLSSRMLDEANQALDAMHQPCIAYNFGGKDNTFAERRISEPSFADKRNLMIIAATAIDKHRVLDQYDSDIAQASAVDAWLKAVTNGAASDGGS